MHLARLPDGDVPTLRLQVARNPIGILQVADIGDLPRGKAAPEAQQIFLCGQLRHIHVGEVFVFLQA